MGDSHLRHFVKFRRGSINPFYILPAKAVLMDSQQPTMIAPDREFVNFLFKRLRFGSVEASIATVFSLMTKVAPDSDEGRSDSAATIVPTAELLGTAARSIRRQIFFRSLTTIKRKIFSCSPTICFNSETTVVCGCGRVRACVQGNSHLSNKEER